MDDLSTPLRTMKRIIILLLALMPIVASAQEYIDLDKTDENGRLVVTNTAPIFSDGKMYAMRFAYSLLAENEMYYTTIVCCDEEKEWLVEPNSIGMFEMVRNEKDVYLHTLINSESSKMENGKYMITTSYIIPINKVYEMLDALKCITIKTSTNQYHMINIDFDTASYLMQSYLELLVMTGR